MANRLFVGAILALWLTSMSWLVVDKIVPSFHAGQPPVTEVFQMRQVVAWRVDWSGEQVGWAASVRLPSVSGTSELHNRVQLIDVPLLDLTPAWMRHVVGDIGSLDIDAATRIEFDSLDNFSAFDSRVSVNGMPSVLRMTGSVEDSCLKLTVRSGDLTYSPEIYLPDESMLSEALFPESRLPYMYVGRRWQQEVYSPFRSPNAPVESVQAEVVSEETIQRGDETIRVFRINYMGNARSGISSNSRLQAVSWVEPDGRVLRQDVFVGATKLRFERLEETHAEQIGYQLFDGGIKSRAPQSVPDLRDYRN